MDEDDIDPLDFDDVDDIGNLFGAADFPEDSEEIDYENLDDASIDDLLNQFNEE